MNRLTALAFVLLAACTACKGSGCSRIQTENAPQSAASSTAEPIDKEELLWIPRAQGPIELDGELEEASWQKAARTGAFAPPTPETPDRPYTEARFLRDDTTLYMALYAADNNLQASVNVHDGPVWIDDAFTIRLAQAQSTYPRWLLNVGPNGTLTDAKELGPEERDLSWESQAKVGIDLDGTLNDSSDEDEEWIAEIGLPLRDIVDKAECPMLHVQLSRCDTPRGEKRRCLQWGGMQRVIGVFRLCDKRG